MRTPIRPLATLASLFCFAALPMACGPTGEADAYWTIEGTVSDADGNPIDGIEVECDFAEGSETVITGEETDAGSVDPGGYICEATTFGGGEDFADDDEVTVTATDVDGADNGSFDTATVKVDVKPAYNETDPVEQDIELTASSSS